DAVPAEELGALPALCGDLPHLVAAVYGVDRGFGQRVAVLRAHQDAVHAVRDYAREALDVAGDDRAAGGHGLQEDDALALVAGVWGAEEVRGLVVAGQVGVGHVAGEDHVAHVMLAHPALVGAQRALAVAADEDEPGLRASRLDPLERAQQVALALALLQ